MTNSVKPSVLDSMSNSIVMRTDVWFSTWRVSILNSLGAWRSSLRIIPLQTNLIAYLVRKAEVLLVISLCFVRHNLNTATLWGKIPCSSVLTKKLYLLVSVYLSQWKWTIQNSGSGCMSYICPFLSAQISIP